MEQCSDEVQGSLERPGAADDNVCVLASDLIDAAYVAEALKRGTIVWDVRSAEEYARCPLRRKPCRNLS